MHRRRHRQAASHHALAWPSSKRREAAEPKPGAPAAECSTFATQPGERCAQPAEQRDDRINFGARADAELSDGHQSRRRLTGLRARTTEPNTAVGSAASGSLTGLEVRTLKSPRQLVAKRTVSARQLARDAVAA